jgi:hypothetical protein
MVTQDQAIEIAKQELTKNGLTVSEYDITVGKDLPGATHWMIWFDRKGPFRAPGGKHAVRVQKNTGQAEFMRGE